MLSIKVPASKSISHRILMGAALSYGDSVLHNLLMSKDIECTMGVLASAGAKFNHQNGAVYVQGMQGKAKSKTATPLQCNMHESGTSCRLLMGILSAGCGSFYVHGAPRLHERPIGALANALQELGVDITYENKNGFPPLILKTDGFKSQTVHINLDESSQYLSALLLAAPCSEQGVTIYLQGEKAVSWPYAALTLKAMEDFGIVVQMQNKSGENWQNIDWRSVQHIVPSETRFCVPSGQYLHGKYIAEGDWSAASYFLAAGVVGKKPLRIQGLQKDSLQGDKAMLNILTDMGAKYFWEGDDIIVSPSKLNSIEVDMQNCPDLVPTVAVLAAFAEGITVISNVEHLRIKESDRLAAPAAELGKVGVKVDILDDGLRIYGLGKIPTIPENTVFAAHNDHRIAMSCAVLGLNGQEIVIDEPTVVQKSFPHFWELWKEISHV